MKDVLEYLFARMKAERPITKEVAGVHYAVKADGTLGEPIRELEQQWRTKPIGVRTLSAFVRAVRNFGAVDTGSFAVQVLDHRSVNYIAWQPDKYGVREILAAAIHAVETPFQFDKWYETEEFLIKFRSSFLLTDEALKVIQVCSTVGAGEAVLVADDGISQEITVKSGTVTRSNVQLPAEGIPLVPWRTFRDVNPVESKFLLRMRGVKDKLPQVALFEIDAKWQLDTIASVVKYLERELYGLNLPIIA